MKRSVFLIIFIWGICLKIYAQGDLLITPKHIVFEGNKQNAELNLMNIGSDSATYSISFRHYNMTENGKLEVIENPDSAHMIADPYLRIFPRKVTLAPGETQVLMLQYRRKPNMLAGEYRSHLWFRDEKNYEAQGKEKQLSDSKKMSVSLIAVFGITIPVIIRTGEVNVSASLSDLKLEIQQDTVRSINLTINRTGNISINGKLTAEYITAKGKPHQIGLLKSAVVYSNLNKRYVSIKLNKKPVENLKNGKLKVSYISTDENKKPVVYAESEIDIMN